MSAFLDSVDEDSKMLLSAEFAESCTLFFDDGTTIQTEGIFDSTYIEIDSQTGASVMSNNSRLTIYSKEISTELHDNLVDSADDEWTATIRGIAYNVKSAQSDGFGWLTLYLKKKDE